MAASTLPGDEKQDERLNPSQQDVDRRFNEQVQGENFNDIARAEEQGTFDDIANNYDNTADSSQEDANIKKIHDREAEGDKEASSGFKSTYTGEKQKKRVKGKVWYKRASPYAGIGGGLGIIAIIVALFTGNAFMLTNMMHTSAGKLDTRGTMMERRMLAKINQKMTSKSGPCDLTKAACRNERMPKVMLSAMADKNIVAVDEKGNKIPIEGNGYVDTNPPAYKFTDADGNIKTIAAPDFLKEYKSNPMFRKTFKAAYNMRFLGYNGKYMVENFFSKYGQKRNGGVASDPDLKESNADTKLDEKLKPTASTEEDAAKTTFKERIEGLLKRSADKVKKNGGDPILMIGTAACVTIELPTFATDTYAAIQAAQVLVLASDLVLSPGGMQQSGDMKAASAAAIGKILTERVRNKDGSLGDAPVDSSIFKSAIGVNKNKVGPNKMTPGYSLITNPAIQAAGAVNAATKDTCNVINSPQAAFAAAGIEGAISVGSAGIGAVVIGALKGIAKLAVVFGGVDVAMQAAQQSGLIDWVSQTAYGLVKDGIGNYVEGARGKDLGDAIGMGLFTYFSKAGSVGGGAVLKTDQVAGFSQAMADNNNETRDEDIATLSPFDTSSQYTFLGSIMSNLSLHSVPGDPLKSSASILGYLVSSPLNSIFKPAAADANEALASCSSATDFGLPSTIAVNPAGSPCTGIPAQYLDMPSDTVMNLVADDIDEDSGAPKTDADPVTGGGNDITQMMNDCGDPDLESMAGCTIDAAPTATASYTLCDANGKNCQAKTSNITGTDADKRAAESLYMMDYNIENIFSGQDDESLVGQQPAASQTNTGRPANTVDRGNGWTLKDGVDYSSYQCDPRTQDLGPYTNPDTHATIRLCAVSFGARAGYSDLKTGRQGTSSIVSSLISTNLMNMFEAAKAAGISFGISDGWRAAGGADYSTYSQHGRGLAVDLGVPSAGSTMCFNGGPSSSNAATCRQRSDAAGVAVRWLDANAAKYGFMNLKSEPWHWSAGEL